MSFGQETIRANKYHCSLCNGITENPTARSVRLRDNQREIGINVDFVKRYVVDGQEVWGDLYICFECFQTILKSLKNKFVLTEK